MKFKIGDIIDYGFFINIKVIGIGLSHYILEDHNGNVRNRNIDLIDKYGKKSDRLKNPDK